MDILGLIEELQALEALTEAHKHLEEVVGSGQTMAFPDPLYEETLGAFIAVLKKNGRVASC